MSVEILMPALSPTMKEGTLAKWLVTEGSEIVSGQIIAEIETDKATMEVEAVEEGTLAKIIVPAGTENVAVNSIIALLAEEGESVEDIAKMHRKPPKTAKHTAKPHTLEPAPKQVETSEQESKEHNVSSHTSSLQDTSLSTDSTRSNVDMSSDKEVAGAKGARIFASPLARRLAKQNALSLSVIKGTGPRGRIVKTDVERTVREGGSPALPLAGKSIPPERETPFEPAYEKIPISSVRGVIAKRLTLSKQTIPHFYLSSDVHLDKALSARKYLNTQANDAYRISVNDMVLKAVAVALRKVPAANACWAEDGIKLYKTVDIAVAVALKDGLITPIIRDADYKSIQEISVEMRQLADKAKAGALVLEDYQGGTVSVSNLGMFGVKQFSAIINPPQACILAVGAGIDTPVVKNGVVGIANVMNMTLCADHRVIDGAVAAGLLSAVKEALEEPVALMV